jgi:23S rRNA (uracil1939-C5)-methyltransferase
MGELNVNRGDLLQLRVQSFALEGRSVARVDGMVIFVHGAVPGDEARVRLTKVKKQFAEAEAVEIITPSLSRTEPRCHYFGTCGGCTWQHVQYQVQADFKRQHVVDALERIGGFPDVPVHPTLGARDTYFYRNKMEFSFGDKWLTRQELEERNARVASEGEHERFALGLHIPGRFDKVLDIEECWLQSELSFNIVNEVRSFCLDRQLPVYSTSTHMGYLRNLSIRESRHTREIMVNLVTRDDQPETMQSFAANLLEKFPAITTIVNNIVERNSQVAIGEKERIYHGPGFITERIGNKVFRISANSFFQTHTLQAERLYETARNMAGLKREDVVFDLYSGTGTISLFVADDVAQVVGIESVESSIEDAKQNAARNGVQNCTFILGELKEKLTNDTGWLAGFPHPNVIITDPPRTGMHAKVVKRILDLHPERIVYVSCNPSTQARDLKLLCESSEYRIREVQPVDMFPHTSHVETVVALGR